jgi:hypothetical protein
MGGTKIQKKMKRNRYVRLGGGGGKKFKRRWVRLGGGWGEKKFKPKKMRLKLNM